MKLPATLVLLIVVSAIAHAGTPAALRDITVDAHDGYATITFLFAAKVDKVVLARAGTGVAQVRMKPVAATRAVLASARLRPGVTSVKAWVERTDVMIANVTFTRIVSALAVTERSASRVVIRVTLGKPVDPHSATPAAALPHTGPTRARSAAVPATPATRPSASRPSATPPSTTGARDTARTRTRHTRWSLSVIVIDAGHGGKDPGAIGIDDVQEKDVTLAVAKYLRDDVKRRMPGVKVVMTRASDTFIELYRRGQLANERGGRLFVSIHCNSMPAAADATNGYECYILSPGHSEDAARVAAMENKVVQLEADNGKYDGLATEERIMAGLAQSAFVRYSEILAGSIQRSMRGSTGIADRGIHQAGFYVLIGASMPAVLVEIGYLSNAADAKVLAGDKGRRRIAAAIGRGIAAYERTYSSSLERTP